MKWRPASFCANLRNLDPAIVGEHSRSALPSKRVATRPFSTPGFFRESGRKLPNTGAATQSRAATRRKRITPFQAKRVAAKQRWRCAMCGELLQEDFEVDHVVPLHKGGSFDNNIESLQALRKRCHMLKSSLEQRGS